MRSKAAQYRSSKSCLLQADQTYASPDADEWTSLVWIFAPSINANLDGFLASVTRSLDGRHAPHEARDMGV